jgi:hypothetical protein
VSLLPSDVISQAMIHLGELAAGGTPTANDAADGLMALNAMQRAMFGTLIGTRLSAQATSGNSWQAENGGEYAVNTFGALFTLTAPLNPRAGSRFGVVDAVASFGTHACAVNPNGRQINGTSANLSLATDGFGGRWWYRPDTANWTPEGDWTASTVIPFPDSLIAYLPFMLAVIVSAQFGADIPQGVAASAIEGRSAFARAYARRGRNQFDPSFGIMQAAPPQQQPGR